jgi:hypothetical protein
MLLGSTKISSSVGSQQQSRVSIATNASAFVQSICPGGVDGLMKSAHRIRSTKSRVRQSWANGINNAQTRSARAISADIIALCFPVNDPRQNVADEKGGAMPRNFDNEAIISTRFDFPKSDRTNASASAIACQCNDIVIGKRDEA